jgi:hypothetical protein
MKRWRSIAAALLTVTYVAVIGGRVCWQLVPSTGSGAASVQASKGTPKEPSRTNWLPRRHLPLVKPVSLAHALAVNPESTGARGPLDSSRHSSAVHLCDKELGFSSPGRAPPVSARG